MLKLRPNCEYCDKDLPADSVEACICSYECTFCITCVETILNNVCPNCGGAFSPRPVRPVNEHRAEVSLLHQPASTHRVYTPYSLNELNKFSNQIKHIKPEER